MGLSRRRLGRSAFGIANSKASTVEPGRVDGGQLLSTHISSSRQSYKNSPSSRHICYFIAKLAATFPRRRPPPTSQTYMYYAPHPCTPETGTSTRNKSLTPNPPSRHVHRYANAADSATFCVPKHIHSVRNQSSLSVPPPAMALDSQYDRFSALPPPRS